VYYREEFNPQTEYFLPPALVCTLEES